MMTKEEISKLADVLYEKFNEMTVLELHQVTQSFAAATGISAAPVMAPTVEVTSVEEQTEFKVVLKEIGKSKIGIIKQVRSSFGLALKEAKDLVEKAPVTLTESYEKSEAENLKTALEDLGATVELS